MSPSPSPSASVTPTPTPTPPGDPDCVGEVDHCGVCNGDGFSCLDCDQVDISPTQVNLDGFAKDFEKLTRVFLRRYVRVVPDAERKAARKKLKKLSRTAHELQIANWVLSWQGFPSIVTSCQELDTEFCVVVSNEPNLEIYRNRAGEQKKLYDKAIRLYSKNAVARLKAQGASDKQLKREAKKRTRALARSQALLDAAIATTNQVPTTFTNCVGDDSTDFGDQPLQ